MVANIDTKQPWTQSPWVAALYGEVGDLCVSTQINEGSFTYQRIWSNSAAAKELDPCVPAVPAVRLREHERPAGVVHDARGWLVQIPVTGWSDRAATTG